MLNALRIIIIILLWNVSIAYSSGLKNCEWNNRDGVPCITVKGTPNTSVYSSQGVNKQIINKQDIINSGAVDLKDVLKIIPGVDIFQSGPIGQQTSVFTRGSESNHTLVLLNGIPINDQSVTDGLFDFGQDFIQTIQQIEIYKGPSGAHFGPNAIGGAVNFITAIDYKNNVGISGYNAENNTIDVNYTKITDNGWHLNFKGATTKSKTGSALADGTEEDPSENKQVNLNAEKWISDNVKFRATAYSRYTDADYDGSATDEMGYTSDNKMYALQTGIDRLTKDTEDNLILHYQNYDREYANSGYLDEYNSEAVTIRGERKIKSTDKLSFGYGGEYKYDWGAFENQGTYEASTKGHVSDTGFFGNAGYKFSEDTILSLYGRTDDHKITGRNETYKINLTKIIDRFKFGITHSTGLRNPTLYELYGTDNYGITGNTSLNPEKSKTTELSGEYSFSDNITLGMTGYRTSIFDSIETNDAYTKHENQLLDLEQEGLETDLVFKGVDQNLSLFSVFSKSKKGNGQSQSRRPDRTHGANYTKKFLTDSIGSFNLNFNYKYFGKHIDYDRGVNRKVKSTDIIDMTISKNLFSNYFFINISNLLDEHYERPAEYNQEGRQIRFGFRRSY